MDDLYLDQVTSMLVATSHWAVLSSARHAGENS